MELRLDVSCRIQSVGAEVDVLFGACPEELVGQSLASLVSPKDRRGLRTLDASLSGSRPGDRIDQCLTVRVKKTDRRARVRGRRDDAGWTMWLEDVLAYPGDMVQRLLLNEARWDAIHQRADEGIAMISADDCLLGFNDRFFELGGFTSAHGVALSEEALSGKPIFELLTGEAIGPLRHAAEKARKKKKLKYQEIVPHRGLFVELKLAPIHLPVSGYAGWCLTMRDATYEEQLRQLTRQVQAKNADIGAMLSCLRQGLCTIASDLSIHNEYSLHLEEMLGTREIAGASVMQLVFADSDLDDDQRHQVEVALALSTAGGDAFTFELNEHILPREFRRECGGGWRIFEADWVPLSDADHNVERIMLTLRDVTDLRELQQEAAAQREELMLVEQLIRTEPEDYHRTVTSSGDILDRAERLLEAPGDTADRVQGLFRLMHTIKGDARSRGWGALANAAHHAEECYDRLRRGEASWDRAQLDSDLSRVRETIGRYQRCWEETLRRESEPARGVRVTPSWIAGMLETVSIDGTPPAARDRLLELGSTSFEDVCSGVVAGIERLAKSQGKTKPRVDILDGGIRPSFAVSAQLEQMLTHVLTNALDHGIEDDEERTASGKSVPATIRLTVEGSSTVTRLRLRDDGRGLHLAALLERESCSTPVDCLEAIFASGLSTASSVTASSGRGVGLDAVRVMARELGGDVYACFVGEPSSPRAPFEMVLELPSGHFVQTLAACA